LDLEQSDPYGYYSHPDIELFSAILGEVLQQLRKPKMWARVSPDRRLELWRKLDEMPLPPLTRSLLERRRAAVEAGRPESKRIYAGPVYRSDIFAIGSRAGILRRIKWLLAHQVPKTGGDEWHLGPKRIAYGRIYLAYMIATEETTQKRLRAEATSSDVITALVAVHPQEDFERVSRRAELERGADCQKILPTLTSSLPPLVAVFGAVGWGKSAFINSLVQPKPDGSGSERGRARRPASK
jgi:hypothetical protein